MKYFDITIEFASQGADAIILNNCFRKQLTWNFCGYMLRITIKVYHLLGALHPIYQPVASCNPKVISPFGNY